MGRARVINGDHRHQCRALGCPAIVPCQSVMCLPHWAGVPDSIKGRIFEAYRAGAVEQPPQYVTEVRKAVLSVARAEGRLVDVLILLEKLYETEQDRIAYLISSQPLLGGKVPVELARTPKGMRLVCEQLQQSLDGAYL